MQRAHRCLRHATPQISTRSSAAGRQSLNHQINKSPNFPDGQSPNQQITKSPNFPDDERAYEQPDPQRHEEQAERAHITVFAVEVASQHHVRLPAQTGDRVADAMLEAKHLFNKVQEDLSVLSFAFSLIVISAQITPEACMFQDIRSEKALNRAKAGPLRKYWRDLAFLPTNY